MVPAIVLFSVTYILMLIFGKYRPYIALVSAIIFIISGMLPYGDIIRSIDFNVLLMIIGTMGVVSLFIDSKMPALLADILMDYVHSLRGAVVALSLFAGIISAFVDNVATVLMVAPVALEICKKQRTNPVPFIIAIAVSSNLQGAATLVGDTTAIMLGSALDMSFIDFFWYKGKPGIFFAVEIGAVISAISLLLVFRKEKTPIQKAITHTKVSNYIPSILLIITILLLVAASFVSNKPEITNGLICCLVMIIGVIFNFIQKRNISAIINPLKAIDYETLILLISLFLMIGGISNQGVITAVSNLMAKIGKGNIFVIYTVIVWASVLISAFIDNIPYVATMIPVIAGISSAMNIDPTLLYFGLLSGATLGGNCTPIGASANITGIGILRKEGYTVKNYDFLRIGIPFTIAAIIPAYLYIWIMYGV